MKRITLITALLVIVAMVVGTFLEKTHGPAFAQAHLYHSLWFMALLALLLVVGMVVVARARLYRRVSTAGIHLAFAFIVAGIILTTFTAQSGRVELRRGVPASAFASQSGSDVADCALPFEVRLRQFEVVNYPGTHAPQDFVSEVSFVDADGTTFDARISMNHIGRHRGYRFYQAGFDDEGAVFLTVAHDPWGITFTYVGYALLLLSMIGFFFDRQSRFRQLLRQAVPVVLLLVMLSGHSLMAAERPLPRTLPKAQAERLGQLYVMYNDRVCPLQTLACDFTAKLCGKTSYRGLSPEQVLSGWIFFYSDWRDEPMFKIKGAAVRQALGIEGRYAALSDYVSPQGEYRLQAAIDSLQFSDPLRPKYLAADEKYNLIAMLYGGQLLKIFPLADSAGRIGWYSQSDGLPATVAAEEYTFVRKSLSYCQELVVLGQMEQLDTMLIKMRRYQTKAPASALPSESRFASERLLNGLNFTRLLAMLFVSLGLVGFVYTLTRMAKGLPLHRRVRTSMQLLLALLSAYLLLLFVLRWWVSGHIPLANGYETMLFLSLCVSTVALLLSRRQPLSLSAGLLLVGFTLLVAMMGGANPSVTNLMPVLNSPLLCIHVAVIMLSYALLAFVMFCSLAALILLRQGALSLRLQRMNQLMLYPAVFLLAAGIFIGAVWANVSWGTYWSWDPKEVWALITLLVYALPLHARSLPWIRQPRAFHLYMVFAFLSVLFTYFGVNFLLGGMHSYA